MRKPWRKAFWPTSLNLSNDRFVGSNMIQSLILQFEGQTVVIEVTAVPTHRLINVRVNGQLSRTLPVHEGQTNEQVLALLDEYEKAAMERSVYRETFRHRTGEYVIEVWPVGRCFRSQVRDSREIVAGPVTWNEIDGAHTSADLAEVMKDAIRRGEIHTPTPRGFFPR